MFADAQCAAAEPPSCGKPTLVLLSNCCKKKDGKRRGHHLWFYHTHTSSSPGLPAAAAEAQGGCWGLHMLACPASARAAVLSANPVSCHLHNSYSSSKSHNLGPAGHQADWLGAQGRAGAREHRRWEEEVAAYRINAHKPAGSPSHPPTPWTLHICTAVDTGHEWGMRGHT